MIKFSPVSRFVVKGSSMLPTLRAGQDVLIFNWVYLGKKPKAGDIVVVKKDGREMVKRVQKVSDKKVYVIGDNKDESTDSRHYGPIKLDQIVGKVIYASEVDCSNCEAKMVGIAGKKDAICTNCGFKLTCCGEP